eukprot:UN05576
MNQFWFSAQRSPQLLTDEEIEERQNILPEIDLLFHRGPYQSAQKAKLLNRRVPHYRSPTGFVNNLTEWKRYSSLYIIMSQKNNLCNLQRATAVMRCLDVLLYPARRMYVVSMQQYEPQEVFKVIAVMFYTFALFCFIMDDVTTMFLMWMTFAMSSAILGGKVISTPASKLNSESDIL